jgi:uncharacterized Tic20 family protein
MPRRPIDSIQKQKAIPMTDPVPFDLPVEGLSSDERQWGMYAHLSSLGGLIVAGLFFLGPLIVWLMKKDQMRFVDDQGKESLNFQLNILLLGVALVVLGAPLAFLTFGIGLFILVPIGVAIPILAIVMPIIAALKANEGVAYRYPYILRIIK